MNQIIYLIQAIKHSEIIRFSGCASLYEHANYGGRNVNVNVGQGALYGDLNFNDVVSSLKVSQGCTFEAYRHGGASDKMFTVTEDVPMLSSANDNHMSWYHCSC